MSIKLSQLLDDAYDKPRSTGVSGTQQLDSVTFRTGDYVWQYNDGLGPNQISIFKQQPDGKYGAIATNDPVYKDLSQGFYNKAVKMDGGDPTAPRQVDYSVGGTKYTAYLPVNINEVTNPSDLKIENRKTGAWVNTENGNGITVANQIFYNVQKDNRVGPFAPGAAPSATVAFRQALSRDKSQGGITTGADAHLAALKSPGGAAGGLDPDLDWDYINGLAKGGGKSPAPTPLKSFTSETDKAAYERFVGGQGNAGTGFQVTDNGSTVTITKDGKSTAYNQRDIDIQVAADKSRQLIAAVPQGAGAPAGQAVTPSVTITHPTEEQLKKYNALDAPTKKQADAYFAGQGLVAGTPLVTTLPTPPVVPKDAERVTVVSDLMGTATNITRAEAAKYDQYGGQFTTVPVGSTYQPPKITHPTETQLSAYKGLSAADKAQADAYFVGLNLKAGSPATTPTGGGTSGVSTQGVLPGVGTTGTTIATNGMGGPNLKKK